jgi:hypothetical protein
VCVLVSPLGIYEESSLSNTQGFVTVVFVTYTVHRNPTEQEITEKPYIHTHSDRDICPSDTICSISAEKK